MKFTTIIFLLFFCAPLAFAKRTTINILSGVPQPSDTGALHSRTGGFGDVAANLIAALEIKKRHPEFTVRLLVTSSKKRVDPIVPTTNEIMKIMVPELNDKTKGIAQRYKGVQVIFLNIDFGHVIKDIDDEDLLDVEITKLLKKLSKVFPASDLNLNFSYYPESSPVLRLNTRLALGIGEVDNHTKAVQEVLEAEEHLNRGKFLELASGPKSLGFMLTSEIPDSKQNLQTIKRWADSKQIQLSNKFIPIIAYSAEWQTIQVYLDALSVLKPEGDIVLFTKSSDQIDFSGLPKNIQIVPIKGMPYQVMHALIYESFLPPLVTGDISMGQALSSIKPTKSFIYEAPTWKLYSANQMKKLLAQDIKVSPNQLTEMFIPVEHLWKLNREELRKKGEKLARFISNQALQNTIYTALNKRSKEWDLISNIFTLANFIQSKKGQCNDAL